jgi:uncharacterized membrane protein YuzA (DUF378 family)
MNYTKYTLRMIAMLLVIVGALNWGAISIFNLNLVEKAIPIQYQEYRNYVYLFVGLAAVYLGIERNTYLPFLDETVFPCNAFDERLPAQMDFDIDVKVGPNSRVFYWAAYPGKSDREWNEAYADFKNSGVVVSNASGVANLKLLKPGSYTVHKFGIIPMTLKPHIHYRYCIGDGMMSEVKTAYI